MDRRALAALELGPVAALYGLDEDASPASALAAGPPQALASPIASRVAAMGWTELREAVRACTACVLCRQRKQAVFGVGSESAPWLFVGEGPGADEDELGDPFVGQAGRLLDGMLAAIGLARGREVYIANVVKCRPPGNRTPTPEEAQACAPFLDRQIELIGPKLIVALGKSAAIRLLGPGVPSGAGSNIPSLASLRGRVHRYRGIPVVVTYHPAYLLRTLPEKAKAWDDLVFARRALRAAA